MWQYGPWNYFPLMMIFPIIFIIVVVFLLARGANCPMCAGRAMRDKELSVKEILDRRYASGDISQEEYQRIKIEIS